MITAKPRMGALAQRLVRRAEAIALRRARAVARETPAANWRDARALWPEFGED